MLGYTHCLRRSGRMRAHFLDLYNVVAKACQAAKDYTPVNWDKYYKEYNDVTIDGNTFRVYLSGTEGPVLVLLHGGGYSGLTWSLFAKEIIEKIECRIMAIDIRGHGETHTTNDENLCIENISDDIIKVVMHLLGDNDPVVFIGHSMGGSLAVHSAQKLRNCIGLVVIDVVEGTALESLASMQTFLRNRPNTFLSIEHAIQWCVRSGQTHNLESARVSMPGQIINTTTGKLAASELSNLSNLTAVNSEIIAEHMSKQTPTGIEIISEDETETENNIIKPELSKIVTGEEINKEIDNGGVDDVQATEKHACGPHLSNVDKLSNAVKGEELKTEKGVDIDIKDPEKGVTSKDTTTDTDEQQNKITNIDIICGIDQEKDMKAPVCSYTWRINLSKTEIHWQGWFEGLSELFLCTPVPKLLLLANIHGLDTTLTVGQMQGRFQMQVLPRCGHAIHEDLPDKVADLIATYLVRQKLAVPTSEFVPSLPQC